MHWRMKRTRKTDRRSVGSEPSNAAAFRRSIAGRLHPPRRLHSTPALCTSSQTRVCEDELPTVHSSQVMQSQIHDPAAQIMVNNSKPRVLCRPDRLALAAVIGIQNSAQPERRASVSCRPSAGTVEIVGQRVEPNIGPPTVALALAQVSSAAVVGPYRRPFIFVITAAAPAGLRRLQQQSPRHPGPAITAIANGP